MTRELVRYRRSFWVVLERGPHGMVIERADGKRFTARVSVLFVAKHEANQPIAHEGN